MTLWGCGRHTGNLHTVWGPFNTRPWYLLSYYNTNFHCNCAFRSVATSKPVIDLEHLIVKRKACSEQAFVLKWSERNFWDKTGKWPKTEQSTQIVKSIKHFLNPPCVLCDTACIYGSELVALKFYKDNNIGQPALTLDRLGLPYRMWGKGVLFSLQLCVHTLSDVSLGVRSWVKRWITYRLKQLMPNCTHGTSQYNLWCIQAPDI